MSLRLKRIAHVRLQEARALCIQQWWSYSVRADWHHFQSRQVCVMVEDASQGVTTCQHITCVCCSVSRRAAGRLAACVLVCISPRLRTSSFSYASMTASLIIQYDESSVVDHTEQAQ